MGMIDNAAGQFVEATEASLLSATRGVAQEGAAAEAEAGHPAPDAYPLASVFYVVMKRRNPSLSDHERTLRFFSFLFGRGGETARGLGYLPLPESEAAEVRKLWSHQLGALVSGAALARH